DISRMDNLRCICHLNLAACQLLGTNLLGALRNCEESIKIKPECVKGYYRSGQVRLMLNEYQLAINDFQKVLEMEPGNRQAKKLLAEAK
ncbi:hypothetical protein HELRODRAFT_153065, partial [Helobdella robusta]|uniref:peptidylprolyl isomerase n=1 Tax=Helobdella robusta TaxID=6412 RepID=T1EKZ1_HELRO